MFKPHPLSIPQYQADGELVEFVQSLPKTETHLHMEGACPLVLLQKANASRYADAPRMWAPDFRYESFDAFMEIYDEHCGEVFTNLDAFAECAAKVLEDCYAQNCRYVETSFHLGVLVESDLDGRDVVKTILDAAPSGLEVRVFMGMLHNHYEGKGKECIDDCLGWDQLSGIDLHGPEYWPLEPWTAEVWEKARAAGKVTKAHAGEFMPAEFVRTCVETLGAQRIEHGVRSAEDESVVQLLVDRKIPLDVCPISNLKLAVEGIPSMDKHPIRKLFDAGVTCTINSDDPLMFGNTLSEEYYALHQDLGFSKQELIQVARNGFEIALLDETKKQICFDELDVIGARL